jgi:hypothetical protein
VQSLSVIMMLCLKLGTGVLAVLTMLVTQGIPAGTALPVTLGATLDARKDKPGQKIEARLMQDVPLPSGQKIKAGAHIIGHIVETTRLPGGGYRMALKFDQLASGGKTVPLTLIARAIAAMNNVYQAELPIDAESNYEPSTQWVMRQIGGEVVNRGRGRITSEEGLVGHWDGAAWGKLTSSDSGDCRAADGNGINQALWLFSTSACGLYGLEGMKLVHDGRTDPVGQIILESSKDIHIGGGSGWFLLVGGTPQTASLQ